MPSDGTERESYYCTWCEAKVWDDADADEVECGSCGKTFDVTNYTAAERLRDNILDANGLLEGGDGRA